MFDKLSTTKGIGEKTIEKLRVAGFDDVKKIIEAGTEGLIAIGINKTIANALIEFATANLPVDDKSGVEDAGSTEAIVVPVVVEPATFPDTVMGQAMAAAAARRGTTVAEIAAALPKASDKSAAPAPKPEPKTAKVPVMRMLDVGIEKPQGFTNPVVLRDFFDRLPNGEIPRDVRFVKNLYAECPMCRATGKQPKLDIDSTSVMVVSNSENGQTNASTFCGEHIGVAKSQAERAFVGKKNMVVEVISLRDSWQRLTRGYKKQIDEGRAKREQEARANRRNDKVTGFMAELDNVDSPFWLTEAQVGSYESPLNVPVLTFGLSTEEAHEMGGILPTQQDLDKFQPKWSKFHEVYGVELTFRPPTDVSQHLELVGSLRNQAKAHGALPYLPLVIVRRHFGQKHGMRYVVVHDAVLQMVIQAHQERTGFEAKPSPMATDWLTRRWLQQRDSVKSEADKAFATTEEGKALAAFLNAKPEDDTAAKDAGLLLSGKRR